VITAVRDEGGQVLNWVSVQRDVTEQKRAQAHERLLLAELQHRVRNSLAVVRSIARRTAENSKTVADYAMHLEGRLDAFARAQSAVTRAPLAGVDLEHLVADELAAYQAYEGQQVVRIAGPTLRLQPKAAETFGLAVHELATNAVKHGALSHPSGRIAVWWHVQEDGDTPPSLCSSERRAGRASRCRHQGIRALAQSCWSEVWSTGWAAGRCRPSSLTGFVAGSKRFLRVCS
jgi:two-component sensor histidine kinase